MLLLSSNGYLSKNKILCVPIKLSRHVNSWFSYYPICDMFQAILVYIALKICKKCTYYQMGATFQKFLNPDNLIYYYYIKFKFCGLIFSLVIEFYIISYTFRVIALFSPSLI